MILFTYSFIISNLIDLQLPLIQKLTIIKTGLLQVMYSSCPYDIRRRVTIYTNSQGLTHKLVIIVKLCMLFRDKSLDNLVVNRVASHGTLNFRHTPIY